MLIAVVSDIHDNLPALDKVIEEAKRRKVEAVIFCGDFCAPFTAAKVLGFECPVYATLGNNDEDQYTMYSRTEGKVNFTGVGDQFGEAELGGRKIAYTHYPLVAEGLFAKGGYDAIFFGHTHLVHVEKRGETLVANPGEVFGILKGKGTTFGVYDSATNEIVIINIR